MTPKQPPVEASAREALYPGSFDPLTNGHVDLIERCLKIFDHVTVAVLTNPSKKPLFSVRERLRSIRNIFKDEPRVTVEAFEGLLVDFARKKKSGIIVRGLREISDFEYEFQMALMNRRLDKHIETVFLMPKEEYTYLSSRLVKEIASLGGKVEGLVPKAVEASLKKKFKKKKK